ncbi:pre-mRNA processing RNA-helicase [Coemansia spiralis]|nr:pre-mRNA processing RNA-helicase [Coemansia spiralis]
MSGSRLARPSSRRDAPRNRRSRSPERRRGRERHRSRSPSPSRREPAPEQRPAASGAKALSMKERLAMWRKRKEPDRPESPVPTTGDAAADSGGTRSVSRASSHANDSSASGPFVTAPDSLASESCSPSDATFESLPTTPQEQHPPAMVAPPGRAIRLSLAKARPGPKRLQRKPVSGLGRSVFSTNADGDDDDDEPAANTNTGTRAARQVPSPAQLSPLESADEADIGAAMEIDEPEHDPLDEFMQSMEAGTRPGNGAAGGTHELGAIGGDDNDEGADGSAGGPDDEEILALAAQRLKKKDLVVVDHSKMEYESFRRNFYIEPAELGAMSAEEVDMLRADLGGIKIRGVDPPKPAVNWAHFGLPAACSDVVKSQGFERPTPIQAQAIPTILSGRDMIGVAKTGSGKTLAFVLPMLRHIKAQRPLAAGDGPVGLIMTPTRELAVQIHRECRPFLRALGLRAVCAYGGSGIKDQIGELKRGCEIIVGTPGRLIDLLSANSGRVTNLRRVTYLVLDEADRMFDMGFEPQVTKIVQGVRPTRQTVLFSATFPRQMEALARKILRRPLEIVVGGRALIPPEVTQHVEVVEERDKFVRLLAILGEAFNGNGETLALVFVDRQEAADALLRELMRRGYVCNSLHGGKDQADRDQAIADFKNRVFSVLIATSIAARGLDVRGLTVVVNYDCPNHMEDLVHRVGRTGRAGNKGDAFTFVTPDQDRYAGEVVKAMKLSGLVPPEDVQRLADAFLDKVREGKERRSKSGFGGKGLEKLEKERSLVKKLQKVTYGGAEGALDDDDDDDNETNDAETVRRLDSAPPVRSLSSAAAAAGGDTGSAPQSARSAAPGSVSAGEPRVEMSAAARAALLAAQAAARRLNVGNADAAAAQPLSAVDQINQQLGTPAMSAGRSSSTGGGSAAPKTGSSGGSGRRDKGRADGPAGPIPVGMFGCELDINDYPQKARWRATNRDTLSQIIEQSGAAVTTRGVFVPQGKPVPEGERKLYLIIEADTERSVEQAKNEIKRILTEATLAIMEQEARGTTGRYSVV